MMDKIAKAGSYSQTSEQRTLWEQYKSSLLSFVERLSSSRRFKMYQNHRQTNYLGPWKASFVERFIILCPDDEFRRVSHPIQYQIKMHY